MPSLKNKLQDLFSLPSQSTEKQLIEKIRLLETVLNTLPIGVTITDLTGKIIYINSCEAIMHGYTIGEILGQDIRVFSPKELWHPLPFSQLTDLTHWERESVNIHKNGNIFPVYLTSNVLLDDTNTTIGVITSCENISKQKLPEEIDYLLKVSIERTKSPENANLQLAQEVASHKRTEAVLKETAQTLQALILSSPLAIIMLNPDETVKIWNPAAQRIFGWREKEVIGKSLPFSPSEESTNSISVQDEKWNKAFTGPNTRQIRLDDSMETRRYRRDGTPVDIRISIAPLFNEEGEMNGTMAIIADITEHKRAEQKLRNSEEQLRALSMRLQSLQEEERRKIAREIHDEFGQALTALKIDLAWINQRLSAKQLQLKDKIQRMSQLIDNTIFTIRRVATQLRPTILDDLGLAAATEWAVGEFQSRTEIKCKLVIEPEYISIDTARATTIFRVLQESLTNIARHAENPTMVDISLRHVNNEICLEVTDNGRGITLEEINDPKSLGLIGIRERVTAWGGTVDIHGKTGIGTAIIVYIPL